MIKGFCIEYASAFAPWIISLVETKQAVGFPYLTSAEVLRDFDRWALKNHPGETSLTRDVAMGWSTLRDGEHINTLIRRTTPVRQLGKHMSSLGEDAFVIPPKHPGRKVRYIAHVFTSGELAAFFAAVDGCPRCPRSVGMHLVVPVFFRFAYCMGMRNREIRSLRASDVDLRAGKVRIGESKGHVSRTVYMSDDLAALASAYDSLISELYPDRTAFFPNRIGGFYGEGQADKWFRTFYAEVPDALRLHGNPGRLHDLRHTFAVNRLNRWIEEGIDIEAMMPYLSTFMGHSEQKDTDYYLHLVPDFYPQFELLAPTDAIIPELER